MEQKMTPTYSLIVAGIGGMGALSAGQLVAEAAMSLYQNVCWCPNMTTARRNAPADCTVVLSNEEITSPLVFQADAVVIVEPSLLKAFEQRVRASGLIMVESRGLKDEVARDDVRVVKVPALETASSLGSTQAANLVMLGAYVAVSRAMPSELVKARLEERFAGNPKLLALNTSAYEAGLKLAEGLASG